MAKEKDAEIVQVPAPKKFMAMRYEWPVDSCTNSNFSIKKGEIVLIPGIPLDESMFATFSTYEDALKFVKKQPVEISSNKITSTATINSKLRRVNFPNDDGSPGKDGYILRDKNIPEEMSQSTRDIISDIGKLDDEDTLAKMLAVEQACDKRKEIIDHLKKKLQK